MVFLAEFLGQPLSQDGRIAHHGATDDVPLDIVTIRAVTMGVGRTEDFLRGEWPKVFPFVGQPTKVILGGVIFVLCGAQIPERFDQFGVFVDLLVDCCRSRFRRGRSDGGHSRARSGKAEHHLPAVDFGQNFGVRPRGVVRHGDVLLWSVKGIRPPARPVRFRDGGASSPCRNEAFCIAGRRFRP